MDDQKLNWIKKLIAKNDLHPFYASKEWQHLADDARTAQHNECQRCKEEGWYGPCDIVHHKKYVKQHPELALSLENLECLCRFHHEEEHKESKFINEERW